jgi:hypothetical protein
MWTYQQSTGHLSRDGKLIATGYSGHGAGLNNPAMQYVEGVGPLPQGEYLIGAPHNPIDHLGPIAMPLTAKAGTDTRGRSAFFMHGDNAAADHSASDGCIIMPPQVRAAVRDSGDHDLTVIA